MSLWLVPALGVECAECDELPDDETCERHSLAGETYAWLDEVGGSQGYEPHSDDFAECAAWGAGWAFAIIGMAEAIGRRYDVGPIAEAFESGYSCGANNAGH